MFMRFNNSPTECKTTDEVSTEKLTRKEKKALNDGFYSRHRKLYKFEVAQKDIEVSHRRKSKKYCKKRTKPATHREIIRPLKTVSIRPPMTELIWPLFIKSAILY